MKNGFKIFDSDLHVIESPNIYEDYVDPRLRNQAPRWTGHPEHGNGGWVCQDNPDTIGPKLPETANDLPLGAVRLCHESTGIQATVVNGQVLVRDGEHTGSLPGELLKPSVAA